MNDPSPIRLRPRKSKHAPNENSRKYVGGLRSVLRLVQMSKRGAETHSATRLGGRAARKPPTLHNWQGAGDARLFKIIVSPEFADRLNLQQHTRELMKRMERDLGTQLEWVAAVHHNTEHPHVHIAVRGMDDKGGPLSIPREYIRSGLRGRAEELATDALGYRSPADAQEAHRRETLQNRYTSLDRILQRSNGGDSSHFAVIVNPDDASLSESAVQLQKHLGARS